MAPVSVPYKSKVHEHVKLLVILAASGTFVKAASALIEYRFFSNPLQYMQFTDMGSIFSNLSGYLRLANHALALMITKLVIYIMVLINLFFILRLNKIAIYIHFILQLSLFFIPVMMIGIQNHSGFSLLAFGSRGLYYFIFQSLTFIGGLLFFYLFSRVLFLINRYEHSYV